MPFKNTGRIKKPIYLSQEEKLRNQAIVDAAKKAFLPRNTKLKAIYRKKNSKQEFIQTGRFIDEEHAKEFAVSLLEEFKKASTSWEMTSFETTNLNEQEKETSDEQP